MSLRIIGLNNNQNKYIDSYRAETSSKEIYCLEINVNEFDDLLK